MKTTPEERAKFQSFLATEPASGRDWRNHAVELLLADASTAAQLEKEVARLKGAHPCLKCKQPIVGSVIVMINGLSHHVECSNDHIALLSDELAADVATLRAAMESAKSREEALHTQLDETARRCGELEAAIAGHCCNRYEADCQLCAVEKK